MIFDKIRITQRRKEDHRLAFVKALKEVSGYGLKEAKDIADRLNYSFDKSLIATIDSKEKSASTIEVVLPGKFAANRDSNQTNQAIKDFAKDLNEHCTGSYEVSGGTEWEREMKLLSLGIGTDSDYVSFITKAVMTKNQLGIEEFISEHLSTLDRQSLEKIYNKLTQNRN